MQKLAKQCSDLFSINQFDTASALTLRQFHHQPSVDDGNRALKAGGADADEVMTTRGRIPPDYRQTTPTRHVRRP